jgi:RimJ/RimL family protein N-acetyltransferase
MFKPVSFENENLLIHPLRPEDLNRYDDIVNDIYKILSDEKTLKFLPSKRLNNLSEAGVFLNNMIINYHSNRNYLHFITEKNSGKVIGLIDLISPNVAMEHYKIEHYPFFIEFYLSGNSCGCAIMSDILPPIVDLILGQGITSIGAIVHRKNIAARKVLEKSKFTYSAKFDRIQDLFKTIG